MQAGAHAAGHAGATEAPNAARLPLHAVTQVVLEEHSPTNLPEYERMCATPDGTKLQFAYDCPDGELLDIFCRDSDGKAQVHGA